MGLERFSAFIPYDTFAIETPYTPEDVAARIQANIEERAVFDLKDKVKRTLRLE